MNRKAFFKKSLIFGVGSSLLLTQNLNLSASTPPENLYCEEKIKFMQKYIKNLMDFADNELDENQRTKLMLACGKRCFINNTDINTVKKQTINEFIEAKKKEWGSKAFDTEDNQIIVRYQFGDKPPKCLCPIVDDLKEDLSKTYCLCTAGYIKSMFEIHTGQTVDVEILETIKWGGKVCTFKISVK